MVIYSSIIYPHIRYAADDENQRAIYRQFHFDRRVMRDASDPFSLIDEHFIQLFRFDKELVRFLFDEIGPHMRNSSNYEAIQPLGNIFVALSFYTTGTYQRVIGQLFNISMSQQSISRCVNEVLQLIIDQLSDRYIKFPQTPWEKNRIKERFMIETHFPGVIGAVDCTHIALLRPTEEEHNYFNRKGCHSKNIKLICDYDLKILNINARYPGSCHDAFIWRNSIIHDEMRQCYDDGDHTSWSLGDSGYSQQQWLMTPVLNPARGSPQYRYNERHGRARNCIERCNGVLKGRFRCLARKLKYNPRKVGNIAVACAVLHNLCIMHNLEHPIPNQPEGNDEYLIPANILIDFDQELRNQNNRNLLIQRYFTCIGIVNEYLYSTLCSLG